MPTKRFNYNCKWNALLTVQLQNLQIFHTKKCCIIFNFRFGEKQNSSLRRWTTICKTLWGFGKRLSIAEISTAKEYIKRLVINLIYNFDK